MLKATFVSCGRYNGYHQSCTKVSFLKSVVTSEVGGSCTKGVLFEATVDWLRFTVHVRFKFTANN